mmetsp:Transcript_72421/g.172606  ORF Transcript_72421/g.172606 Transcript_72421/m.172606 type:complete len:371 (-) Transcript_72421:114-1226(-)
MARRPPEEAILLSTTPRRSCSCVASLLSASMRVWQSSRSRRPLCLAVPTRDSSLSSSGRSFCVGAHHAGLGFGAATAFAAASAAGEATTAAALGTCMEPPPPPRADCFKAGALAAVAFATGAFTEPPAARLGLRFSVGAVGAAIRVLGVAADFGGLAFRLRRAGVSSTKWAPRQGPLAEAAGCGGCGSAAAACSAKAAWDDMAALSIAARASALARATLAVSLPSSTAEGASDKLNCTRPRGLGPCLSFTAARWLRQASTSTEDIKGGLFVPSAAGWSPILPRGGSPAAATAGCLALEGAAWASQGATPRSIASSARGDCRPRRSPRGLRRHSSVSLRCRPLAIPASGGALKARLAWEPRFALSQGASCF